MLVGVCDSVTRVKSSSDEIERDIENAPYQLWKQRLHMASLACITLLRLWGVYETLEGWQLQQDERVEVLATSNIMETVCVCQKSSPFFIYYFSSVLYKTSQQHKYPTWKAYCILFKIVVLMCTSHISWILKTEFAGQLSPVLMGRFILKTTD